MYAADRSAAVSETSCAEKHWQNDKIASLVVCGWSEELETKQFRVHIKLLLFALCGNGTSIKKKQLQKAEGEEIFPG